MTRFFTLLLLLLSANADQVEDAKEVLKEWDDPNLEIISRENQSSKLVGQSTETQKRKAIQDSEEKDLKDFIGRFYENLDEPYNDEYDAEMDYNKRNIDRANWNGNGQKKKDKDGNTERHVGNVSKTTALLNKQKSTLKLLEQELLQMIIESESKKGKGHTWKEIVEKQASNKSGSNGEKGKGHTWKEIVEKQASNNSGSNGGTGKLKGHTWKEVLEKQAKESLGKGPLNNTELLKKQKEDLDRMEESLTNIIKKVEEKGQQGIAQPKIFESNKGNVGGKLTPSYSDSKKNVDQVIDRDRLREAEQKDRELEERIQGWKTVVEGDKVVGPTPKGQQSVGPLVDDIHR